MKSILSDIPVIDRSKISVEMDSLSRSIFGDDAVNAYQILYLADEDGGSDLEILTKYFREQGITSGSVLIDNTW